MARWSLWRSSAGLKAAQVNALTRLARVMAFSDPTRCVTLCERAVRCARTHDDPLLQARTEMLAGTLAHHHQRLERAASRRCAAARQKMANSLGPEKPAYYEILYAHVAGVLRGEYETPTRSRARASKKPPKPTIWWCISRACLRWRWR